MEHWREIPGFSNYEASQFGNIRNKRSKHVIGQTICNGYKRVVIMSNDGKRTSRRVSRLVALSWIPNPNNYPQVDHINEDKLNNKIENLEWVTASMNCKRRFITNPNATKPVAIRFENDQQILVFKNSSEASRHFGVSSATIWGASINRRWKGYTIERITQDQFNEF